MLCLIWSPSSSCPHKYQAGLNWNEESFLSVIQTTQALINQLAVLAQCVPKVLISDSPRPKINK